jgi:hypothetical protein
MAPLTASAHDVRGSAIYLDVGRRAIAVELHLPVRQLLLALQLPNTAAVTVTQLSGLPTVRDYIRQHVHALARDGSNMPLVIDRVATERNGDDDELIVSGQLVAAHTSDVRWFDLHYDAILQRVVTHNAYVFLRRDVWRGLLGDHPQLLGVLHWQSKHLVVDRAGGSAWQAVAATFLFGTQHVAEGTDHLLFLLMLLLPMPLRAASQRWGEPRAAKHSILAVIKLVTAFSLGHSITLFAGVLHGAMVPAHAVEILIAASIVLSAVHALRPLFAGGEVFIAAGFGLVHGLAFASALQGFGFDTGSLVLALLGFNLGIEAMQLGVVLMVMPWLLLLAQQRAYRWLLTIGAVFGISAGLGWIAERAFGVNLLVPMWTERVAAHATWLLVALAATAVLVHMRSKRLC